MEKRTVFLYRKDVEPTNNVAERALRHSVIHRIVMGCFRSVWGAKTFDALASAIDTAELSGTHPFGTIQSLSVPRRCLSPQVVSRYRMYTKHKVC